MITAKNLTKYFGELPAVKNATFAITNGEVVGFLGANGAGKTTTIRMLTTFLLPTSGQAKIAGYDLLNERHKIREVIGYMPEHPPLYPELTVVQYLNFMAEIHGLSGLAKTKRIGKIIEQCALTQVCNKRCNTLSKGFKQRVGFAQAIIHEPQVIFLDEPTNGLDPAQLVEFRKMILSLRDLHTIVISSHVLPEIKNLCSRALIFSSGQVKEDIKIDQELDLAALEQCFLRAVINGY